ncbi:MAG: hypothetical protein H0V23_14760 [Nocardioidaceae bacterium]|nr:hypothetical protein [Nocardioidaceae bacterium]
MTGAPRVGYGDSLSIGQLAQQWRRSAYFVQSLIKSGLLHPDERGLFTPGELQRFYKESGPAGRLSR